VLPKKVKDAVDGNAGADHEVPKFHFYSNGPAMNTGPAPGIPDLPGKNPLMV
jgi:hypothetical protein